MEILKANPYMALFLALFFGYLIGKFKVGKFQLGGIAGTLIAAVAIGQIGIQVDGSVKDIFFALFIYCVGYAGGPEFFNSINRSTVNQVLAAVAMCVTGLFCVLVLARMFHLGAGLAAGLAAGGLTQSAIIGTAGSAIDLLGLGKEAAHAMKVDVAVGYSVTYIFGSLGPILMITAVFPMLYKWDIRREAVELARKLGGGTRELGEGEYDPLPRASSRVFKVGDDSKASGMSRAALEEALDEEVRVESVIRDGRDAEFDDGFTFRSGDLVMVTGLSVYLEKCGQVLGEEYEDEDSRFHLIEESRKIFVANSKLNGKTLGELDEMAHGKRFGIFCTALSRMGHSLPILPGTMVHVGDEITLSGSGADLDRIEKLVGYKSPSIHATEFMTFGLGMALGYLLGLISFHVGSAEVSIGSGLGCLVSGLLFGYLRAKHPRFGGVDTGAATFMQTFGLAVFVGVVGLDAGKSALTTMEQHGVTLFYLGVAVTLIPQIVVFFFNYYVLRIKNPVTAMAVVAGSRSANPGFSALLEKAGNATPVAPFTVTYAIANILLTLWGPVIVAVMH